MTQDARDQEHENTQPSDTSASGESPQQTSSSDDVGNEDLATAFLRETEVVEEAVEDGKRIRRKGIYLLPNLFTKLSSPFSDCGRECDGYFVSPLFLIVQEKE